MKNNAKVSKKTCRKTTARKPTTCERTDKLKTRENYNHPGQSGEMSHRRTRYSKEVDEVLLRIYTHTTTGDPKVLDVPPPAINDGYPILQEEVEITVKSQKKGKSAGVDNIPLEAGGEAMINMSIMICNKIQQTGEWPTPWTQTLIITLPKKGNLQLCQNYHTIS